MCYNEITKNILGVLYMSENTFLNIAVPEELIKRIDDYRFENRFPSRAEAARFLLDRALKQNPKP